MHNMQILANIIIFLIFIILKVDIKHIYFNSTSNLFFLSQTFTMPDSENILCTLNHFNGWFDLFYCIDL